MKFRFHLKFYKILEILKNQNFKNLFNEKIILIKKNISFFIKVHQCLGQPITEHKNLQNTM